ncbi:DNA cytosine methyltransferase, partial [Bacteroides thetaiotaomicron]|uniref:DNA cytosine methyltransferase n=1 Tax=Bacteroides thetaiotaomicron TaxID=818 RepID=UPI0034A4F1BF
VLPSDSVINNDVINELISIGILSESNDITKLKIVTKDLYQRLINCVNFYLDHKEAFGGLLDKLSNSKRRDLQIAEQNNNKPTIVDFFAGAGGLSCGFVQAGFKVCFANDFEDVCVRTYRFNHPELPSEKVVKGDIRHIVDNINDYINQDVDVVIGGPPCQGFSSANQQRIIDDPRNELYKYYIKAVSKILPKFVVMENVKGMLTVAEQVVEDYGNINEERNGNTYSYSVAYKLLNSADFAVAQSRERLIYIAIRNDVIQEKGITPQQIFAEIELANNGNNRYLLRDALEAIKSLDAPRIKNMNEVDDEKTGKKIDINKYNGNENGYLRLINNNRIIPILYNHKARYVNEINYDIYRLLDQGD